MSILAGSESDLSQGGPDLELLVKIWSDGSTIFILDLTGTQRAKRRVRKQTAWSQDAKKLLFKFHGGKAKKYFVQVGCFVLFGHTEIQKETFPAKQNVRGNGNVPFTRMTQAQTDFYSLTSSSSSQRKRNSQMAWANCRKEICRNSSGVFCALQQEDKQHFRMSLKEIWFFLNNHGMKISHKTRNIRHYMRTNRLLRVKLTLIYLKFHSLQEVSAQQPLNLPWKRNERCLHSYGWSHVTKCSWSAQFKVAVIVVNLNAGMAINCFDVFPQLLKHLLTNKRDWRVQPVTSPKKSNCSGDNLWPYFYAMSIYGQNRGWGGGSHLVA